MELTEKRKGMTRGRVGRLGDWFVVQLVGSAS